MSNLVHWPARLNELLEDATRLHEQAGGVGAPMDIVETEAGYEVSIDLPGVAAEQVQVEFKEGRLWVTGEREAISKEEGRTYHRMERRFGKFRRVIALPKDVDTDKIEAGYEHGVLKVTVPKSEAMKPRKIEIK